MPKLSESDRIILQKRIAALLDLPQIGMGEPSVKSMILAKQILEIVDDALAEGEKQ